MLALVDCDSFFVSCQVVFNPKLRSKPVIVLSGNDGCVVSRSKEAKALGIPMGIAAFKVKDLIKKHRIYTFSSNFPLYGDMSQRVMAILLDAAPRVSIYSIDEAFLDLSTIPKEDLKSLASELREKIYKWTGISVTIGVAPTKTLAKVATNKAKKNSNLKGVHIFYTKNDIYKALCDFPVEEIWGVGRESARFLKYYGIDTAHQFSTAPEKWLRKNLKIFGLKTQKELQGVPSINFTQTYAPKKQIIRSRSFKNQITEFEALSEALASFVVRAAFKLREQGSVTSKISVYIRTSKYSASHLRYYNSAEKKLLSPINDTAFLIKEARECLKIIFKTGYGYKKAGVVLSDIVPEHSRQMDIFRTYEPETSKSLLNAIDNINNTMGARTIQYGAEGLNRKSLYRSAKKSGLYTTSWEELLRVS